MRRSFALLLCALVCTAGCSSSNEPTTAQSIVPLAVGNRWIGEWINHTDSTNADERLWLDTTEIVGTLQANGETWYIQKVYHGVMAFQDTGAAVLLTNRADGVYSRDWRTDTSINPSPAHRIATYPASIGDTVNTEAIGSMNATANVGIMYDRLDKRGDPITVPAGQYAAYRYETYLAYDSSGRVPQDFGNTQWYVDGVGLVKTIQRGIVGYSVYSGTGLIKIPSGIEQGHYIGYRLLNFTHR